MFDFILADADILPETLQFLGVGWFIVHIVAIPLVAYIGFAIGKKKGSGTVPKPK